MVKVIRQGVYFMESKLIKESQAFMTSDKKERAVKNTVAYAVSSAHGGGVQNFDALLSAEFEDVFRTADAMGLRQLAVKNVLFSGARNDPDFAYSVAKTYGAELVPEGLSAPAEYVRERIAKSGAMLFGTSAFPCGALGAVCVRGNEGDYLRQLLGKPFKTSFPETVAVYFRGKPGKGVGPTDIALSVLKAVRAAGNFAAGKLLECFGPGLANLSMDFRNTVDSMLCASDCFAAVWATDGKTQEYFETYGRAGDYKPLAPREPAFYGGGIVVDLSRIEPMIAFYPEIYPVRELLESPAETSEKLRAAAQKQCAEVRMRLESVCDALKEGTPFFAEMYLDEDAANYETVSEVAELLRGKAVGGATAFNVYPASAAVFRALIGSGALETLLSAGVAVNGYACAGSGLEAVDGVPVAGAVVLDARTMAATAANGGILTSALGSASHRRFKKFQFDENVYRSRVVCEAGSGGPLRYGNVRPIPEMGALPGALSLQVRAAETPASFIPTRADGEQPAAPENDVSGEAAGAVVFTKHAQGAPWPQAIAMREENLRAVFAAGFEETYRTHLIDWGILPFVCAKGEIGAGDLVYLESIREAVSRGEERVIARAIGKKKTRDVALTLGPLTEEQRAILLAGSRVGYERERRE